MRLFSYCVTKNRYKQLPFTAVRRSMTALPDAAILMAFAAFTAPLGAQAQGGGTTPAPSATSVTGTNNNVFLTAHIKDLADPTLFDAKVDQLTDKTNVVILNPKHKPDGSVMATRQQIDRTIATLKLIDANLIVVNDGLFADPITRVYKVHFLRDALPQVVGSNGTASSTDITSTGTDTAVTGLAAQLTAAFPGGPVITTQENALIARGAPDQVHHLQEMLALYLDVPSPQVRADIFTIQINSRNEKSRHKAAAKADEIKQGIQIVRDLVAGSILTMNAFVSSHPAEIKTTLDRHVNADGSLSTTDVGWQGATLGSELQDVGFDTNPVRQLSLSEILVFLTLMEQNDNVLKALATSPRAAASTPPTLGDSFDNSLTVLKTRFENQGKPNLGRLIERIEKSIKRPTSAQGAKPTVFLADRLAKLYTGDSQPADIAAISRFVKAWHDCSTSFQSSSVPSDASGIPTDEDGLAGRLAVASASTDAQLKIAMDALSADLQELFFQPLLDWIREDIQGGPDAGSGIDIVGHTSIVVRDRTLAETAGTAQLYTKFTPIPQLTLQNLKDAQTLSAGGPAPTAPSTQTIAKDKSGNIVLDSTNTMGNPVILTNGQSIEFNKDGSVVRKADGTPVILTNPGTPAPSPLTALGALTPLQSLGLTALLQAHQDPVYRNIAPGTSIAIRPFVVPDGGAARVQINLVSTVGGDNFTAANQGGPLDRISSQSVVTEASISDFDLLEVASFGVQTTALGDYKWTIPILDQVPVLGDVFHGPRGKETHRQESIAIVNLTILPRSLDLVPFYRQSTQRSVPPVAPAGK